jgi:hypothetical protein
VDVPSKVRSALPFQVSAWDRLAESRRSRKRFFMGIAGYHFINNKGIPPAGAL